MPTDTMECLSESDGLFEVRFTATKDGTFDLHIWAEKPDPRAAKNERSTLPES